MRPAAAARYMPLLLSPLIAQACRIGAAIIDTRSRVGFVRSVEFSVVVEICINRFSFRGLMPPHYAGTPRGPKTKSDKTGQNYWPSFRVDGFDN